MDGQRGAGTRGGVERVARRLQNEMPYGTKSIACGMRVWQLVGLGR